MKIGTVRAEEASVFDQYAGYHQFHRDSLDTYGSFEIFWHNGDPESITDPGWYWWSCYPGCLPDGDPMGPFADSRQALQDADEWNPEFDE